MQRIEWISTIASGHLPHRPLLIVALCAFLTPRADAQVTAADSAAIVQVTQRLMDAITSGDTATWAAQTSPRWFITDEEGRHQTRADFLHDLRGLPSGQSGRLQVANPYLAGAPGVVIASYDIDEWHDFYGQELRTRFHTTDTWVRERGAWRLLASQITALPTPVAGRTVARRLLDEYAGSYGLSPEIALRIVTTDSGIAMVRGASAPQPLYAIDDRIFVRHGVRGFWLFERDERGAVARLVNWRDNNPVVWRRRASP